METKGSVDKQHFPLETKQRRIHSNIHLKNSAESMNENTFVVFMPSTGHLLQVDDDRCYGCAACIMVCPVDALNLHGWLVEVDHATCTLCDHCLPSCPVDALSMELIT